jgi:hypothetical protein
MVKLGDYLSWSKEHFGLDQSLGPQLTCCVSLSKPFILSGSCFQLLKNKPLGLNDPFSANILCVSM